MMESCRYWKNNRCERALEHLMEELKNFTDTPRLVREAFCTDLRCPDVRHPVTIQVPSSNVYLCPKHAEELGQKLIRLANIAGVLERVWGRTGVEGEVKVGGTD